MKPPQDGDAEPFGQADATAPVVKVVDRRWWAREKEATEATGEAEPPSTKPSYVEELERQLAEKNDLLQTYLTKYREAANEFEQVKARLRRDVAKEVERSRRIVLTELLEVMDNLDRAANAGRETVNTDTLLEGVNLVRHQFRSKLQALGVTRLEALGRPFDPARHEAMSTVPAQTPDEDGTVVAIIREGYAMGEEVVRPAGVAVAKAFSHAEPSAPSNEPRGVGDEPRAISDE